ncbi:MAG: hypothetical protein Q8Q02_09200 [Nocardioides sp.]|nr:hypothetical protein [Nocardioides sp.]
MPERVRVADLVTATGWTPSRVRQQIRRGLIKVERDDDGAVWVPIEEAERVLGAAVEEHEREAWRRNAALQPA